MQKEEEIIDLTNESKFDEIQKDLEDELSSIQMKLQQLSEAKKEYQLKRNRFQPVLVLMEDLKIDMLEFAAFLQKEYNKPQ